MLSCITDVTRDLEVTSPTCRKSPRFTEAVSVGRTQLWRWASLRAAVSYLGPACVHIHTTRSTLKHQCPSLNQLEHETLFCYIASVSEQHNLHKHIATQCVEGRRWAACVMASLDEDMRHLMVSKPSCLSHK